MALLCSLSALSAQAGVHLSTSPDTTDGSADVRDATPYFGWALRCRDVTDDPGVAVESVTTGSPAHTAGVRAGDRVFLVDGRPVDAYARQALAEVETTLAGLPVGSRVHVSFARERAKHTVLLDVVAWREMLDGLPTLQQGLEVQLGLLDDLVRSSEALQEDALLALVDQGAASTALRGRALHHLGRTCTRGTLDRLRELETSPEIRDSWTDAVHDAETRLEFRSGVREIEQALRWIRQRYVDQERVHVGELTDAAIDGMLDSLDPYSDYMTDRELTESRRHRYEGVGITLESYEDRHTLYRVLPQGPSHDLLFPDDEILVIDGEPMVGQERSEVVERIRGKAGEPVRFEVRRPGLADTIEVEIVRQSIQKDVVTSRQLPAGIAYVRLHTFSVDAHREVAAAVDEMREARALILDLRGNRGGSVDEVQRIASIFVGPGELVAYSQGRDEFFPRRDLRTGRSRVRYEAPLVLLVDGRSASAAEMLAGSLQLAGRAPLVGEPTYGKGVGQSTFDVQGVAGKRYLKLTTFRYYFADGRCIHGDGVTPDRAARPSCRVRPTFTNAHTARRRSAERSSRAASTPTKRPTAGRAPDAPDI